jgi:hypothetical protein
MAKEVRKRTPRALTRAERYQRVFGSPDGNWVLHDLMQEHNILGTTLRADGSVDTAKEGERVVVLRILAQLKINVARLRERIEEHERTLED